MPRRLAAEAVGTALLVALGPGAAAVDAARSGAITHLGVACAFGIAVTLAVILFGETSGAHINPAVTIALWADRQFEGHRVLPYIAAQCLGAILAAMGTMAVVGNAISAAATVPSVPVPLAFAIEAGLSLLLMAMVLEVTRRRLPLVQSAALLGLTVGVCALVGGPLTGASMNPARSLGPALAGAVWDAHWIYWTGPIFGMLLAVGTNKLVRSRSRQAP